ncbi:MAG TPA: hypothetical protein VGW36_02435 [Pyrinomonadaceae bacterium]|nr:hypothetical protein [Pyrinomonadaceae bacterium]
MAPAFRLSVQFHRLPPQRVETDEDVPIGVFAEVECPRLDEFVDLQLARTGLSRRSAHAHHPNFRPALRTPGDKKVSGASESASAGTFQS